MDHSRDLSKQQAWIREMSVGSEFHRVTKHGLGVGDINNKK